MGLAGAFVASQPTPWLQIDDRVSTWVLRSLAGIRTPWLTGVANGINAAGSGWGVTVTGLSVVALTIAFRCWRHLLVFLFSLGFLQTAGTFIYLGLSRPRPYGVPIVASWGGYSGESPPVALLTIFLMGIVYCLAVPGRTRTHTTAAVALVIAVFCLARLYLGVDHPDDALLGAAFAVAIAVTAFGSFTPNEVFPVAYRRGRTAHVDVTGPRGEAIRRAVHDQLGLTVAEIKPVGLESSAGLPRCGCGSMAARMSSCSPSSTPGTMSARTAGTSWGGPSSMDPWREHALPRRRRAPARPRFAPPDARALLDEAFGGEQG